MSAQNAGGGLPAIAARVWQDRARIADRYVAEGRWPQGEAERRLRPWLAICLLAGAPLDVLPRALADEVEALRRPFLFIAGKGAPVESERILPEQDARAILASDLCGALRWSRDLGGAANRAAARHTADPTGPNLAAWRDLAALSRALDVILPWHEAPAEAGAEANGPSEERKAA